jgi:hypothetical protein
MLAHSGMDLLEFSVFNPFLRVTKSPCGSVRLE